MLGRGLLLLTRIDEESLLQEYVSSGCWNETTPGSSPIHPQTALQRKSVRHQRGHGFRAEHTSEVDPVESEFVVQEMPPLRLVEGLEERKRKDDIRACDVFECPPPREPPAHRATYSMVM